MPIYDEVLSSPSANRRRGVTTPSRSRRAVKDVDVHEECNSSNTDMYLQDVFNMLWAHYPKSIDITTLYDQLKRSNYHKNTPYLLEELEDVEPASFRRENDELFAIETSSRTWHVPKINR